MPAEIGEYNGQVTMAYQGATPWHQLGHRMTGTPDVAAALAAANMEWEVATQPLFLKDGREVDSAQAVVRDDGAILGTVGSQFHPIQNSDAFGVLSDACAEHGVTIEAAGALGTGARTWMLAKMPESIEPVPLDRINGYFLICNGHDGSLAYGARPTPIRVICQNTLNTALRHGKDVIRIRHTKSAKDRITEARRLVTGMVAALTEAGETFAALAARQMTPTEVADYVAKVIPNPTPEEAIAPILADRRRTMAALVWGGKGAALAGSKSDGSTTAWAAYNAVVEYFDHVRPAEAKSDSGTRNANESAIFGGNQAIKVTALKTARELVAAA